MAETISNTVVDYTIDALREAIRSGAFVPGQRLIVADITRMFSVSAGPVREAIRRLTGEGLIEIKPHRGASVRQVTGQELRDIHQLRAAIEGMAARLAAGSFPDDAVARDEWEEIKEEMDRAAGAEDRSAFIANNQRFHDLILRLSGNPMMREYAQQLIMPMYQFRLPHRMTMDSLHRSYACHQRIIAAIEAGDGDKADAAMREHILDSGQGLVAALEAVEAMRAADRPPTRPRSTDIPS